MRWTTAAAYDLIGRQIVHVELDDTEFRMKLDDGSAVTVNLELDHDYGRGWLNWHRGTPE